MGKIILLFAFCILLLNESFSQDKLKVYLSGITGKFIKRSQLSDTTIKIITNSISEINNSTHVYFSGPTFKNVMGIKKLIGKPLGTYSLIGLNDKLLPGCIITIDGFNYINKKTKEKIHFEGSSYTVIDD